MITQRINQNRQRSGRQASAARLWVSTLVEKHQNGEILNNIGRFINVELMLDAIEKLNPVAAAGIDRVTVKDFRQRPLAEIQALVSEVLSRRYRCKPNRGVVIPKPGSTDTRILGVQCCRDKVVGAALKELLEPVCEAMFSPYSFGFRPGRSCHQAIAELEQRIVAMQGCFILDLDVQKFFDRVQHDHLMVILRKLVSDPIILHAFSEFLRAGILIRDESRGGMKLVRAGQGTPQGGVTSPLLANLYLHEVFDSYLRTELGPSIPGGMSFVRYADDIVCMVKDAESARRVRESLDKRFGYYGIPLHPAKSKTFDFRRPDLDGDGTEFERSGFNFLGFRIEWDLSRTGAWKLSKRPAAGRTDRSLGNAKLSLEKKLGLGHSSKMIRGSAQAMVNGFEAYFKFDDCQEDVQFYQYELKKVLASLRIQEEEISEDDSLLTSTFLPLKFGAGSGESCAKH